MPFFKISTIVIMCRLKAMSKKAQHKKYFFKLSPFSKISTIVIVCYLKIASIKGGEPRKIFFRNRTPPLKIFYYSNYTTPKFLGLGLQEKIFKQPPTAKFLNIIMLHLKERKVSFEKK